MEFYCNFYIYNAVSVYLLPGVEFVLYMSVFTTFLSNIKKERDLSSAACALLTCVCVNTWLLLLLFVMCSSVGLISWFCPLSPLFSSFALPAPSTSLYFLPCLVSLCLVPDRYCAH